MSRLRQAMMMGALWLCSQPAWSTIHHEIDIELLPDQHRLQMSDRLTLTRSVAELRFRLSSRIQEVDAADAELLKFLPMGPIPNIARDSVRGRRD